MNVNGFPISEINSEFQKISNDSETVKFVELCKKYQLLISKISGSVYPQFQKCEIIENNWIDKSVVVKNKFTYSTNICNCINYKPNLESQILDILQEFVDNGFEKLIKLKMYYSCWIYLINGNIFNTYTLQQIIDHRREQILK